MSDSVFTFHPIGYFKCAELYPYDAPRQPEQMLEPNTGVIQLLSGSGYEQALEDLAGFSHLWVIFLFDRHRHWKPKTRPPRGDRKVGLFSTRSPYRPNPIGMSCVLLESIQGLSIRVRRHDLLDGTPILDLKPYIPYADAFPDAKTGWLEAIQSTQCWSVTLSAAAQMQIEFLCLNGGPECLNAFIHEQLSFNPLLDIRKRVSRCPDGNYCIAYRTWRVFFSCDEGRRCIAVLYIDSGYSVVERMEDEDKYGDKVAHRLFCERFGSHY